MSRFHEIKLELVRPGPPHNQLLSPLTPYMALCGEGSPITFHIELEHHQLLSRLERLRYVTPEDRRSGMAVPHRIREATVVEMGEDIARIFGELRTLLAEEWRAVGDAGHGTAGNNSHLIHLRLVLSGSELSLLPFEMASAPQAFPGEGLEKLLQSHMPIVLTREIRRTRPVPIPWDRPLEPRVLLVSAAPGGLEIPLGEHAQALRAALEPWVRWPREKDNDDAPPLSKEERTQQRVLLAKQRLRLLTNASIEDIYKKCAEEKFTHIHILAHGDYLEVGGERRFGLALCKHGDPQEREVISGRRLAKALHAEGTDGSTRSQPLVVTMATCDAGNPGSVLVPGGSIAHDLHAAGIPWVFASQFPLTWGGSERMVASLYPRLLRGDDPRQALFETRRLLFMSAERDHDWASMVAYVTIPNANEFEDQVVSFFEHQMRRAIEVSLDRADYGATEASVKSALDDTDHYLELWSSRLPTGDGVKERARRAEFYGMCGSVAKRIGLLHYKKQQKEEGKPALERSLAAYRTAMEQWALDEDKYHWVATQLLSLTAVLEQSPQPAIFLMAHQLAQRDLENQSGSLKAWAHGTMAELEMLAKYHVPSQSIKGDKLIKTVEGHCQAILDLVGESSFEVHSTKRQFQRYIDYWAQPDWLPVAEAAVKTLTPRREPTQTEFPPYD